MYFLTKKYFKKQQLPHFQIPICCSGAGTYNFFPI
jgi:hypothetical protein